jgi:succinate-acetate transporter protein
MAELRKAGGATGAVTAFIAYYVGFADLVAVGGITLPLGKLA